MSNDVRTRVAEARSRSCFAAPLVDSGAVAQDDSGHKLYRGWNGGLAPGAESDPELDWIPTADPAIELATFNDDELAAFGRLIPSLLCGEESAVVIFRHEARRYGRKADEALAQTLQVIASEEERHELLLRALMTYLPEPDDLDDIHGRAVGFFMKLGFASSDPIHRLNHIGALDRCVCQVLGALVNRSTVMRAETFHRIVGRIRSDEARHVKICRGVMANVGVSKADMAAADETVRSMFIEMMAPIGVAFDSLGVDPDKLFQTISREHGY